MPYKKLRVFVASPSDVQVEREALTQVADKLNRTIADKLATVVELLRWEINVVPDMGSPQTIFDERIAHYDVFIGIMWKRFGTLTGEAGSGTEHEFDRAYQSWASTGWPRIMFYFCNRPIPFPRTRDEVDQLGKVVAFKEKVQQLGLCATYHEIDKFAWLVHEHLTRVITELSPVAGESRRKDTVASTRSTRHMGNVRILNNKLDQLNWIAYAPVDFDPDNLVYPSEDQLKKDFDVLVAGPFNGIITFGSEHSLGLVPKVAKECGLKGVIMGIWHIKNTDELEAAVACKDIVDGYCVGHRGVGSLYALEDLLQTIDTLRERTNRPISTTESISDFIAYPQLVEAVDWIFPDVHYYWHEGAVPEEVVNDLMSRIRSMQDWFKDIEYRKVVLKMVSYPSSGAFGLTESDQARFFKLLLRRIRDDTTILKSVRVSFFAAFDNNWKAPERGWSPADRSTGLYTVERCPKAALRYIRNPWEDS